MTMMEMNPILHSCDELDKIRGVNVSSGSFVLLGDS